MMQTAFIPYGNNLEGFTAYHEKEKKPLVILCHAWKGRDDFIIDKAKFLASLGYATFALDMYGKGVIGKSKEENAALKKPFVEDRYLLQKRVLLGYDIACSLPFVDSSSVAVLGFGFGGICALDLARSGANLKGAISVYGHFSPPPYSSTINAKILALHGYNDSIVTPNELSNFEKEMDKAKADWQVHKYGGTLHAFANPSANDPDSGLLFNPTSSHRAWITIQSFLSEIFEELI